MDWSKAKNILLVGLVVANLALLAVLVQGRYQLKNEDYSADFIHEVLDLLEERGIRVEAPIAKEPTSRPSLQVAIESSSPEGVNRDFFGGQGFITANHPSISQIRLGQEEVTLVSNRRLIYENEGARPGRDLDREGALALALDFLEARNFSVEDLDLVHASLDKGAWRLSFTMVYEGDYVESSFTHMTIKGQEVAKMDRLWIQVLEVNQTPYVLPSGAKALLALLDQDQLAGRTLISLDPCYYFNPEAQGSVEEISQSLHGQASPAWRLVFDDGQEMVVDIL